MICQELYFSFVQRSFVSHAGACQWAQLNHSAVLSSYAPVLDGWYGSDLHSFAWISAKLIKILCFLFCLHLQNCNCFKKTSKPKTKPSQNSYITFLHFNRYFHSPVSLDSLSNWFSLEFLNLSQETPHLLQVNPSLLNNCSCLSFPSPLLPPSPYWENFYDEQLFCIKIP